MWVEAGGALGPGSLAHTYMEKAFSKQVLQ